MALDLGEGDQKLYEKLLVSRDDIDFAKSCALTLIKKGWHSHSWQRRGTIYFQQSVYMTALVTGYARPFTRSHGWQRFELSQLLEASDKEAELHGRLLALRNELYAHSDSRHYDIAPWRMLDPPTAIVGRPSLRMSREEADLFIAMTGRMTANIQAQMKAILDKY